MARVTSRQDSYITIQGLDECLRGFNGLERELKRNANSELRAASKAIARDLVPMLGGSGAPQEAAILAAAGPKSDRYIVVAVPSRKPRLSGVKRQPAAMAKRLGFAIEGGSDAAQFHGPSPGSMVARHSDRISRHAIPRYLSALEGIMRKYGLR